MALLAEEKRVNAKKEKLDKKRSKLSKEKLDSIRRVSCILPLLSLGQPFLEAKIVLEKFSGRSRGFGFVTFDVEDAKEEVNLYTLLKLNPYAKTARRMALLAEEKRVNTKKGEAVQCHGEAESFGVGASVLGRNRVKGAAAASSRGVQRQSIGQREIAGGGGGREKGSRVFLDP